MASNWDLHTLNLRAELHSARSYTQIRSGPVSVFVKRSTEVNSKGEKDAPLLNIDIDFRPGQFDHREVLAIMLMDVIDKFSEQFEPIVKVGKEQ
jgi:hypothetical protein